MHSNAAWKVPALIPWTGDHTDDPWIETTFVRFKAYQEVIPGRWQFRSRARSAHRRVMGSPP
jgi:hypothetical protein